MTFERGVFLKPSLNQGLCLVETSSNNNSKPQIAHYEDSVVTHLQNILQSDQHQTVISSAKVLCETVRDMIGKIGASASDTEIDQKCVTLTQKLDSLLQTLHEETEENPISPDAEPEVEPISQQDHEEDQLSEDVPSSLIDSTHPMSLAAKKLTRFRQREILMSRANSLKKAVRQIIEHAEKTIDEQTSASTPLPPVVVVRPLSLLVQGSQKDGLSGGGDSPQLLKKTDDGNGSTMTTAETQAPLDAPESHLQNIPSAFPLRSSHLESQGRSRSQSLEDGYEKKVRKDVGQSEKDPKSPLIQIQVESPSSSSRTPGSEMVDFGDLLGGTEGDSSTGEPNSSNKSSTCISPQSFLTVPGPSSPSPNTLNGSGSSSNGGGAGGATVEGPREASPRACRRVSIGSLYKPLEVEIPKSPHSSKHSPVLDMSEMGGLFMLPSGTSPSKDKNAKKTMPIVNPLVSHPSWPAIAAGGVVSKVLLANADTICAVASPLMDPEDEDLMIGFDEKCVLNNYFGIGIDAKITLDFHLKREEHPEKCQSRTRNMMWYGVLGSKEFLQQTCKNLEQRVQLECDGKRLPLPSLQGIVILNIQSFMGGTNFWGGTKGDDCFLAPSFDDRILEVVAVFDSMQMAASRLINLQHHRIAQCHSIKITLLGDEPVPVQVDGEAWLQPPGVIKIIHKNRMQMLCRNRALESSLKSWEEKQKQLSGLSPTSTEPEDLYEKRRHSSKGLFSSLGKSKHLSEEKQQRYGRKRLDSGFGLDGGSDGYSEETYSSADGKSVDKWTASEVGDWLDYLQMGEYKPSFLRHDIQGSELFSLKRRDLKDLGITKIGHIKRILQAIDNLNPELK